MEAEILQLRDTVGGMAADDAELREQVRTIESQLAEARAINLATSAICDTAFPGGLYHLETDTDYGAATGGYAIYHVSLQYQRRY